LGWYGKNANLLIDGAGSWFVLGSIITTAELPAAVPVADGCGSCHRCMSECPTGAIIEPGVIDARRCLAWIIQKPGIIPIEFREAIGSRIYGCDDCQDSCPPSMRLAQKQPLPSDAQMSVDVLSLLAMTDDEVINNFGRWYIHNREVRWVRRNALVVLGNCAAFNNAWAQATLASYMRNEDPHLRVHAIWASRRLGISVESAMNDSDPMVQHELSLFTAPRR
jgi:epoxyqueuosine reductase